MSLAQRLWDKDPSLWKRGAKHAAIIRNSLGWLDMPRVMEGRIRELQAFASEIREAGFAHAAVLGMGGSSLAPEVLRRTFPAKPGHLELHVLDSTHPGSVLDLERRADPAKTLYIVSSKSGTTVEPSRFLDYFHGKAPAAHFAAITDPGTALEKLAKERGFRKIFLNFPDIGGRYSALSYFGLAPAALLGVDLPELLKRARKMSRSDLGPRLAKTLADLKRDKLIFLLSPAISSLGLWLEQLLAESLGKEGKGFVPVADEPAIEPKRYGKDRVFIHIRVASSDNRALDARAASLEKAGHPVLRLELDDPLDLGAEFFRWEVAAAVLGHYLKINPFDQPDVQSAKERTQAVLERLSKTGALPEPPEPPPEKALASLLNKAKAGGYVALLAYLCADGSLDEDLDRLRAAILRSTGNAVQFGYGPRYLHSTGQLHKGGPATGLFLILDQEGEEDAAIPGAPYTFAQLCSAQARGDFAALKDAGRKAAYIRLRGNPRAALRDLARAVESDIIANSRL